MAEAGPEPDPDTDRDHDKNTIGLFDRVKTLLKDFIKRLNIRKIISWPRLDQNLILTLTEIMTKIQ